MVRRKAFVVPPLGGISTQPAKAGTTNIKRDPCNFLTRIGFRCFSMNRVRALGGNLCHLSMPPFSVRLSIGQQI